MGGVVFEQWVPLIQDLGIPIALVVFFVYRDKGREDRLNKRIDDLWSYQAQFAETIVKENTAVLIPVRDLLESFQKRATA